MKPPYKDRSRETWKVVSIDRWSLFTGSFSTGFNEKPHSREMKNVVFIDRWSLYKAGLTVYLLTVFISDASSIWWTIVLTPPFLLSLSHTTQDRTMGDGVSKAIECFESAAGAFKYLGENFSHAPSMDMSGPVLAMLGGLMLVSWTYRRSRDGFHAKFDVVNHGWILLKDNELDVTKKFMNIEIHFGWISLFKFVNSYVILLK